MKWKYNNYDYFSRDTAMDNNNTNISINVRLESGKC